MKKLIAVSIILLLAMSACKKERQGVDEPNWNAINIAKDENNGASY